MKFSRWKLLGYACVGLNQQTLIKFDPKTEKFSFIGDVLDVCMVFGGVVAEDGNIYGFSLYSGLLKLDVEREKTEMILKDTHFGCFGTKLGINGRLYGIPGDSEMFWECDLMNNTLVIFGKQIE